MTPELLERTRQLATDYLSRIRERRVGSLADYQTLLDTMGGPLPQQGESPLAVIERLAEQADPGLVATPSPAATSACWTTMSSEV